MLLFLLEAFFETPLFYFILNLLRIPALLRISTEKNTIKSLNNDIKQLNNKLAELQASLEAKEDEISQLRR